MNRFATALGAALLLFAGVVPNLNAQVITNGEIDRGLRFPHTATQDGEPYTARYSYGLGYPFFYMNGSSTQLRYLDYLDKADRAQKFGYRPPVDPYFPDAAPQEQTYPERPRFGLGILRRR